MSSPTDGPSVAPSRTDGLISAARLAPSMERLLVKAEARADADAHLADQRNRMAAFVATLNLPSDLAPDFVRFHCGCAAQRDLTEDRWYGSPCASHVMATIAQQVAGLINGR